MVTRRLALEVPYGVRVNVAARTTPRRVAEIVTDVFWATAEVVIGKSTLPRPCGTVALAGTTASGEFDRSVADAPPAGALPFSRTVPVEGEPPLTEVGKTETNASAGG